MPEASGGGQRLWRIKTPLPAAGFRCIHFHNCVNLENSLPYITGSRDGAGGGGGGQGLDQRRAAADAGGHLHQPGLLAAGPPRSALRNRTGRLLCDFLTVKLLQGPSTNSCMQCTWLPTAQHSGTLNSYCLHARPFALGRRVGPLIAAIVHINDDVRFVCQLQVLSADEPARECDSRRHRAKHFLSAPLLFHRCCRRTSRHTSAGRRTLSPTRRRPAASSPPASPTGALSRPRQAPLLDRPWLLAARRLQALLEGCCKCPHLPASCAGNARRACDTCRHR